MKFNGVELSPLLEYVLCECCPEIQLLNYKEKRTNN